jgi:hypothetical protein
MENIIKGFFIVLHDLRKDITIKVIGILKPTNGGTQTAFPIKSFGGDKPPPSFQSTGTNLFKQPFRDITDRGRCIFFIMLPLGQRWG